MLAGVTAAAAPPCGKHIPTVPFPFVDGSKRARTDAGVQVHLAGLDLPVVTGVPLVPGPLNQKQNKKKTKMNKTGADFYLIWNKSTKKKNYNFILLLCVVGRRPLPLGGCRDFGLGPAGRALTRRTSCFRDKKKKKFVNRGFFFTFATEKTRKSQFIFKILTNGFCFKL